jgi:flavin reductase (DIM6/NTAB) family NADH-FMN oxidoreductase RutF
MVRVTGRNISALLNPRPVVLLSCCDSSGRPNAMTAIWHTPISHEPPIVGVSIGATRHSHRLIEETRQFVLNIVGPAFQKAVEICGNYSGSTTDKTLQAGLCWQNSRSVLPPRITDALGYLECRVVETLPFGDHSLFVASVLYAEAQEGCFSSVWEDAPSDVLLCRQREAFGFWAPLSRSKQP